MTTAPIPIDPMIQQLHLSLTNDPTEMVVDFVSSGGGSSPNCVYGSVPSSLTQVALANTTYIKTIGNVSHALLSGLTPGQRVFYACSDSAVASSEFNFTAGALQEGKPQTVAVFADFGVNDGCVLSFFFLSLFSPCPPFFFFNLNLFAAPLRFGLDQIARDAEAGLFDFALHAGDWVSFKPRPRISYDRAHFLTPFLHITYTP